MKKIALLVLFMVMIASLAGCKEKMLKPDDMIGGMKLLNFCEGAIVNEICTYEELDEGTCVVPAGVKDLWIAYGWGEKTAEELETAWKDSVWKLTFDDHPIDLAPFGTYDIDTSDPLIGPMKLRVWNFCVSNITPGKHHARYDFYLPNAFERGNHAHDWTFTVLGP